MLPLEYIGFETMEFEMLDASENIMECDFETESFVLADACSWSGVSTEVEEEQACLFDWDDITEAIPTSNILQFDDIDTMDVQKIDAQPEKYGYPVSEAKIDEDANDPLAELIADIIFVGLRYGPFQAMH